MRTLYIAPLLLALGGCTRKPPQLSEGAQMIMDRPMPTTESERISQCAGTVDMLQSFDVLLPIQGRSKETEGYKWVTMERARLSKCIRAEMTARDVGFWEQSSR